MIQFYIDRVQGQENKVEQKQAGSPFFMIARRTTF